ncbi:MAG: hypothetical protein PHW60_07085 [Kiritimatiellae bacterium]|nr:hypothetical protein [Kiritimatiellia bacterium]
MNVKYQQGGLAATPEGACFPERPYFPIILANGTDAIMVNPAGSTDSLSFLHYSGLLPDKTSLGWFKTDRKNFKSDTSYGSSLCLAHPATLLFIGTEEIMPIKMEQVFDPKTATVTTRFSQFSHRDPGQISLKVTTFLTDEHILVERYEVLEAPATPFHLEFCIRPPRHDAGTCGNDLPLVAQGVEYWTTREKRMLGFSYEICGYRGACATWYDVSCDFSPAAPASQGVGANEEASAKGSAKDRLVTAALTTGTVVTCYTAVLDSEDTPDPKKDLTALIARTQADGYAPTRAAHVQSWQAYNDRARVRLPASDLQYIYDTSLYVLNSVFNRATGFMPMGILPYQWQNCMFWDSWFCSMAWLGSNRRDDARRISEFWIGKLDEARDVARQLGVGGARFSWTSNRRFFTRDAARAIQFHNNGDAFIQMAQVWQAGGDAEFLEQAYPVMEDALRFLIEKLVRTDGQTAALAACAGPDESVVDKKSTDTWTCAGIIKSIDYYLQAAEKIGRKPYRPDLPRLRALLWDALNRNVDEHGVMQSFHGGRVPHWGSLIFSLFPDHPARANTMAAISKYDKELDGYNSMGLNRYLARNFTWAENWAIRILAESGDAQAWERLRKNAKFTNCYGGIPERIFCHGELYRDWFFTAHAAYLWAVHGLLLQRVGEHLRVLMTLPPDWKTVSFENLTTEDGLRVSAGLKDGRLERLEITNDHTETRIVQLSAPGGFKRRLTLEPGQMVKCV